MMSTITESHGEKRADSSGDIPRPKRVKVDNKEESKNSTEVSESERFKARKFAMLLSYLGTGYLGMQRNPGVKTIEEDLLQALFQVGLICQEHLDVPQRMQFQRAARTDKGVSAVRQMVSIKLPLVQTDSLEAVVNKINSHLPSQIRVIGLKKTTKGFNSKLWCDARTYSYMMPTFAFTPVDAEVAEDYRIPEHKIEEINKILAMYKGTHNFHNFTAGRKPNDASSKRYILLCECGQSFVREGLEFVIINLKGQSFMLHQIRKMIGLMIAIMRGLTDDATLKRAWNYERIDIPIAPAVGLHLEDVHYEKYNYRYGGDGLHEALMWGEHQPIIQKFKEDYILQAIVTEEKEEKSMLKWLETLPLHTFDIRESGPPQNCVQQLGSPEVKSSVIQSQPQSPELCISEANTPPVYKASPDTDSGKTKVTDCAKLNPG